jgi:Protein of unknown function (DUF3037)
MINRGERSKCTFQLFRFVPHPAREEAVNIGVMLRTADSDAGTHRIEVRFTHDWRRVTCLDPEADTVQLEAMEEELRRLIEIDPDTAQTANLEQWLSLGIQVTDPKAYLARSLSDGLDELMRLYVDELFHPLNGRAAIYERIRTAFENAQVWDLMRKRIEASEYTRHGDSLLIDAGYGHDGVVRMFHAVSLEKDAEMAKALAFSTTELRNGVQRVEKASLELNAVVASAGTVEATPASKRSALFRFGVATMEEHGIRVLSTDDLAPVAEAVREDLRFKEKRRP